jgi:DNA polymerase-3 subunit beta
MLHFVIPQHSFSIALDEVKNAVASRPTHPILANVRLDADAKTQTLTLTAYDLNLAIRTELPAQVVFDGAITVAHKLLNDIVSRLPDEDVTFSINDAGMINLKCGSGKYQLHGLPIEEFPELPEIDPKDNKVANLSPNVLLQGLAATLFATSGDETKQILTGVHITVNESIEFAATDGHRLSVLTHKLEEGDYTHFELTIPSRSLREIEKLCKTHEGEIAVSFDRANMIFMAGAKTVISRLLDGAYPNYRQLIPSQFSRQITVERKLFISALERIAVLADQKNNIVKLTIEAVSQSVALSVEAPDVAAGREEVPAQISGEDLEIAFNIKYFLEGVKSFDCNEIQLQFNNPTSPAVIVPIGAAKHTYLLMPVQIRN